MVLKNSADLSNGRRKLSCNKYDICFRKGIWRWLTFHHNYVHHCSLLSEGGADIFRRYSFTNKYFVVFILKLLADGIRYPLKTTVCASSVGIATGLRAGLSGL
jgi:hypothetical protein